MRRNKVIIYLSFSLVTLFSISCSHKENIKKSPSIPSEVPLHAYDDSNPMDSLGRFTGWPKDKKISDQDLTKLDFTLPVPKTNTPIIYYRLEGLIISGKLAASAHRILPGVLHRLVEWQGDKVLTCPGGVCGDYSLPINSPLELVFWVALSDFFIQADHRNAMHYIQIQKKLFRGRTEGEWVKVVRELLEFKPAQNVTCRAQRKEFRLLQTKDELDSEISKNFNWKGAQSLEDRIGTHGKGEVWAELSGVSIPETTIDKVYESKPEYTLAIHIGFDTKLLYNSGSSVDWAIKCESNTPIFASALTGWCFDVQREDVTYWHGQVYRCK